MLYNVLKENRDLILETASKYSIHNVRVFGSVARFEDGPNSDLDLIVEIEQGRSLFDLISFKHEVEDLLRISVDIVTENSIHPSIKQDVLSGAIPL